MVQMLEGMEIGAWVAICAQRTSGVYSQIRQKITDFENAATTNEKERIAGEIPALLVLMNNFLLRQGSSPVIQGACRHPDYIQPLVVEKVKLVLDLKSSNADRKYSANEFKILNKIFPQETQKYVAEVEAAIKAVTDEESAPTIALEKRLAIMDKKLDQVPIISTVVREHGNTIDAMIDEDKSLRKKIYDLSDRLDSHDRVNKFICSAFNPAELQGQAKEMYGLICPKAGHDEF